MKRYEKLGMDTEAALKWVRECHNRVCMECPARSDIVSTALCASSYLLSDVPEPPKVPRWQTAKTQDDFAGMHNDFRTFCDEKTSCAECKYCSNRVRIGDCFYMYLSEVVEVQE